MRVFFYQCGIVGPIYTLYTQGVFCVLPMWDSLLKYLFIVFTTIPHIFQKAFKNNKNNKYVNKFAGSLSQMSVMHLTWCLLDYEPDYRKYEI